MNVMIKGKYIVCLLAALFYYKQTANAQDYGTKKKFFSSQIIYPEKLPLFQALKNPGIGIEQANQIENRSNKTEPARPLTPGPRNTSLDGVAAQRYSRPTWWDLEPTDNEFYWGTLEANINQAWSMGQQFAFGIISHNPVLKGYGKYFYAEPDWYRNDPRNVQCTGVGTPAGCTYYLTDFPRGESFGSDAIYEDVWASNQAESFYISQQLELIEAIRMRYDNPQWAAKIAYIDMRNWGNWGEWHNETTKIANTNTNWPEPDYNGKKAIADAYLAFEYIPVIANFQDEEMWIYACDQAVKQEKVVGWRTDGTDKTASRINTSLNANSILKNAWKNGPIYGEPTNGTIPVNKLLSTNTQLYAWHFSGWNNKYDYSYSSNSAYKTGIDDFRAKGGYRLAINKIEIPEIVPKDEPFTINVELSNDGVTKLFRKYYSLSMKLTPTAGGEDIFIHLSGELDNILPGSTATFTALNQSLTTMGEYSISVGIVGDSAFNPLPITLANINCKGNIL